MVLRFSLAALLLATTAWALAAPGRKSEKVETSPHVEALQLVFQTEPARIREIDKGEWWQDVKERAWVVKRPFSPGTIDSTHLFNVSYRIDRKEVAAWLVDTAKGDVQRPKEGESKKDNPLGGRNLSTFKRLPKASDVTALRISPAVGNRTDQRLTAATFAAVIDSMRPVSADDPQYKAWSYADWHSVEFETAGGRFQANLYLGGLALLSAPDGTLGLVTFEHPK